MASRGCKVRLVDLNPAPVIMTKASGVAERSMEILPQAVSDSILKTSKHVQKARLNEHDGSGNARTIGTVGMTSEKRGGKGLRSQMQWLTEKALTDYLESLPDRSQPGQKLKVSRPYELLSFEEIDGGVQCKLKNTNTGATERVFSKFLVGCDGGRSTIRKGLGFTFDGEATPEYFFAIHATLTGYMGEDTAVDMYFSKGDDPMAWGFTFAMPMPDGGYLIIVDLDPTQQGQWATGDLDRNGYNVMREPDVEDVLRILRSRGCGKDLGVKPGTVKWLSHFRVNSRQTSHYGKGRIYLAGDACHCHSPLGGQGMNMGFNDAKNIAWKLAYAAKGAVPLSFLDTYEKERQPLEHKILVGIERAQKVVPQGIQWSSSCVDEGSAWGPSSSTLQWITRTGSCCASAPSRRGHTPRAHLQWSTGNGPRSALPARTSGTERIRTSSAGSAPASEQETQCRTRQWATRPSRRS